MPVSVPLVVADPPAAPAGYVLCAYEIRTYSQGEGFRPLVILSGTQAGFEEAAHILVKAVGCSLRHIGVGVRLAAVAWFADRPLEECESGRERLVSVFDLAGERWGEWTPEERVGTPECVRLANASGRMIHPKMAGKLNG